MNGVLWGAAWILAVMFLLAGSLKLLDSHAKLVNGPMPWAGDFPNGTIKTIGVLEVAAAVGLVVPPLTGIATILAPLAAAGLVGLMIGAFYTHIRRDEQHFLMINAVLMVLAIVVIWGRLGPYPFAS